MRDQENYSIKNFLDKDIVEIIHKKDFIKWSKYEKKKYDEYLNLIYPILNKIHKVNYGKLFWDTLLGHFLLFHISFCCRYYYSNLKKKSRYKKISNNKIKILDPKSYQIPQNRDDYRNYFQFSDSGQDQLFSLLVRNSSFKNYVFFKKKEKEIKISINPYKEFLIRLRQYLSIKIFQPEILFTGTYLPIKFLVKLKNRYKRKISFINFFMPNLTNKNIFWLARDQISNLKGKDSFDTFFFSTLKYSLPKSLLESFQFNIYHSQNFLNNFRKLKFIFNENLSEDSLFLIAFARIKKIKLIHIEHNWIQHQFIGNIVDFIKNKFDIYLTNGWKSHDKNIIAGGSYFFQSKPQKEILNKNKKKLLFITGPTVKRAPYTFSGHDAHDKKNRNFFVEVSKIFFNNLNDKILSNMWFRTHPLKPNRHIADNEILKSNASKARVINVNKETYNESLSSSDLIITNYLSTPYIESLYLNKPTIIIYNSKVNFLNSDNRNFYDDLFRANIMYKDPIQAAKFIKKIWKNPHQWWQSKRTQSLRKRFLDRNIKDSFYLESKIKKLLN